jgi:hypothetical protein
VLLRSFYDTIVHFLHLLLIADRATTKEIDIARGAYFDKDSGTYDNIECYWKVGIARGYYYRQLYKMTVEMFKF